MIYRIYLICLSNVCNLLGTSVQQYNSTSITMLRAWREPPPAALRPLILHPTGDPSSVVTVPTNYETETTAHSVYRSQPKAASESNAEGTGDTKSREQRIPHPQDRSRSNDRSSHDLMTDPLQVDGKVICRHDMLWGNLYLGNSRRFETKHVTGYFPA